MGTSFKKDLARNKDFYIKNHRKIQGLFGEAVRLFNIEYSDNEILGALDKYCGIDFLTLKDKEMHGLASRVNYNQNHHNSLTIRYKRATGTTTEYEKRVAAIKANTGRLYASLQMQMDSDRDLNLLRGCIVNSDNLYIVIDKNIEYFERNYMHENYDDGNLFFKFTYQDLQNLAKACNFDFVCKEYAR